MNASPLDIRVQDIDHCGIVAGMIDEMELVPQGGSHAFKSQKSKVLWNEVFRDFKWLPYLRRVVLVDQINRLLGTHPQEIISAGQVVKAMIINGLGFVSAPLYLFEKFFVGKATEHLLGEEIRPEHLNDDRLGRVLDKLYSAGLTEVFVSVALQAARKFRVQMDSLHLDSSSFHVDGEYAKNTEKAQAESGVIEITYGYSRDHRPDLKQFILDLICSGDGDIPLYLRVANGNEAE